VSLEQSRTILITGATGAIGAALARYYAAPGVSLLLQGRQEQVLAELAEDCRQKGAGVECKVIDLTRFADLRAWLETLLPERLPDLIIASAGVNCNIGEQGQGESWQEVEQLLDINIKANFVLMDQFLPALRQRGSGQIVLLSSLAAYYGLPITPSYCASKAAIKAYGEALRGWLAEDGIQVSVVMPGYVDSFMCRNMPGPKPFLWTAERAAAVIDRGLAKNRARISFPFPLNLGCWFLAALPPALSQRILKLLNYSG